jgi:AraC family transcriptional regulator
MQQKYYIKGMVCERCIYTVKKALEGLGIGVAQLALGEVTLVSPSEIKEPIIEEALKPLGFSLVQDKKLKLVKDAKALVAEVYSGNFDFPKGFRFSSFAAERLNTNYDALSTAFSATEHTTLEKYIIDFRINLIKELLVYSNKTLADIAFELGFSSIAHLSRQFKSYTGLNPSHFREIRSNKSATQSAAGRK